MNLKDGSLASQGTLFPRKLGREDAYAPSSLPFEFRVLEVIKTMTDIAID